LSKGALQVSYSCNRPKQINIDVSSQRRAAVKSLLLLLALLVAAPKAADVAAGALQAAGHSATGTAGTAGGGVGRVSDDAVGALRCYVSTLKYRFGAWAGVGIAYRVVLAATLSAVDTLLGESVSDALQSAALAELAGDEVVDTVLGLVDGLDASDFGLVESVCRWE
jgi:hypothetical protein